MRKTGALISLSEQDIVDCSLTGCIGGWPSGIFMFIKNRGGIMSEISYPYVGKASLMILRKLVTFAPASISWT